MHPFSLTFLATYFLSIHINCDSKSSIQWNRTDFPRLAGNLSAPFAWGWTIQKNFLSAEHSSRVCLKNVEKCMDDDSDYETTTKVLSNYLFSLAPPFDLSQANITPTCRKQSEKYLDDLQKFKMWALKMYDSSAKLPSGILNGNLNQLGDFDMCLQAEEKSAKIKGQYCLASIQVEAKTTSPYVAALHRLAQSHYHFKSRLDDPGHRVPKFSSFNWAVCVPSGCSSNDVEMALQEGLARFLKGTDLDVKVQAEQQMCHKSHYKDVPLSTIIALCLFLGVILVEIGATFYDHYVTGDKNPWIMAFSLKKNFISLVTVSRSADDIEAVHGIRFVNSFMLIISHKCMAIFFVPYVNRTEMVEFVGRPWTVLGRAASLYTDPFIMFSGTLTAYAMLGKLKRNGKLNVIEEYCSRLLRIVPTFAALIAFCTLILPWINSGPMWNTVVTHHSEICKQYWWRNLLFIHNYFGFKDMCLTHTHHVGIDTQLFFLSPILVLSLWKWPRKGAIALFSLALISTIMRYYVTYTMRLSNYIHFGTSIDQLFKTADYMYTLPAHRATVYIMGVFLGYILRNYKNISLTPGQIRAGNTLALFSFMGAFFGPAFMGKVDYIYNPTDAAWYAAFAPILWCFSFGWVVFTAHVGYKGALGKFFSWPWFTVWTKISYTVYLTQFPIFFYNVGITRTSQHYGFFRILFNVREFGWIIIMSVILTILFESPFQNIRSLVLKKRDTRVEDVQKKIM